MIDGGARQVAQDALFGTRLLHQFVKEGAGLLYEWGSFGVKEGEDRKKGWPVVLSCSSVRNIETRLQNGTRMR